MGRPKGSRNANYEEERDRLATLVLERLREPEGSTASLRSMAKACDVSPTTLRHYFGGREGAIIAALERAHAESLPALRQHFEQRAEDPIHGALPNMMEELMHVWLNEDMGDLHRIGLKVGLGNEALGHAYLEQLLEPTLSLLADIFETYADRGELDADTPARHAAFSLLSPLFMALLHQRELGGAEANPIDLKGFIAHHTDRFLEAYAATAHPRPNKPHGDPLLPG